MIFTLVTARDQGNGGYFLGSLMMCDSTRRDLEVKMYIIFIREILISMIMKHQGKVSNWCGWFYQSGTSTLPAVAVSALTYGKKLEVWTRSIYYTYTLTGLPPDLPMKPSFHPMRSLVCTLGMMRMRMILWCFMTRNPTTVMIRCLG